MCHRVYCCWQNVTRELSQFDLCVFTWWNFLIQSFGYFFIPFSIPIWLQTFLRLTSKSNSSSVWICLRVSIVSSSFDNSRTAPNCFRASSALVEPPSFFSLMTVTTTGFLGSEVFYVHHKEVSQRQGERREVCRLTVGVTGATLGVFGTSPLTPLPCSPSHALLTPNLCCHTLTIVN